jgi:hypothetical protein
MPKLESFKYPKLRIVSTEEVLSIRRVLAFIAIIIAFTASGGLELRAQDAGQANAQYLNPSTISPRDLAWMASLPKLAPAAPKAPVPAHSWLSSWLSACVVFCEKPWDQVILECQRDYPTEQSADACFVLAARARNK